MHSHQQDPNQQQKLKLQEFRISLNNNEYEKCIQLVSSMQEQGKKVVCELIGSRIVDIDVDVLIDIILNALTCNFDYLQDIKLLENALLANMQDAKYVFMIYRSKIHQIDDKDTKYKYLSCMRVFANTIHANQSLREDYSQMLIQYRKTFQDLTNRNSTNIQSKQVIQQYNIIKNIYIQHIQHIIPYIRIHQHYPMLQTIININIINELTTHNPNHNQIHTQLRKVFSQVKYYKLLQQCPIIMILYIVRYHQVNQIIWNKQILSSMSIICLSKYLPHTTQLNANTNNILSSSNTQVLLYHAHNHIKHQTQISTLKQVNQHGMCVDMLQFVHVLTIYMGFLDPNQLPYSYINHILNLNQFTSLCRLRIWQYCLGKSQQQPNINYKIYCISNYRKLIIQINKNKSQTDIRLKGEIGVSMGEWLKTQYAKAQQMLVSERSINHNYFGHLIGLTRNWLLIREQQFEGRLVDRQAYVKAVKGNCDGICSELRQMLSTEKNQHKFTQIQLTLFQIAQLSL